MRNLVEYPVTLGDLIQALQANKPAGFVGSCHPYSLELINEYLLSNKDSVEQFLENKRIK